MAVTAQPQTTLYEKTIEDTALEATLENRDDLRAKASEARAFFKEADDKAKAATEAKVTTKISTIDED